MESSGNLGGAPLQLPGRPCGRGGGRAGSRCPAPGHLGGVFPSSPPRPVLHLVTLPAPPATQKFLERGQGPWPGVGWAGLGVEDRDGVGEGAAAGRDRTEAGAMERGAGTEQRDGQQGRGRERLVPGASTAPPPRDRALCSGAPGWRGGGPRWGMRPELRVGGVAPGAARPPPPSRLECPRRLGCREPENPRPRAQQPRQQIYLLCSPISAPSGQVFAPAGAPGSCGFCYDNWGCAGPASARDQPL